MSKKSKNKTFGAAIADMCRQNFTKHEETYKIALVERIVNHFNLDQEASKKLTQELHKCISQEPEAPSKGKWNSFTLWRKEEGNAQASGLLDPNASLGDVANQMRALWKDVSPEVKTCWQQKAREKNAQEAGGPVKPEPIADEEIRRLVKKALLEM